MNKFKVSFLPPIIEEKDLLKLYTKNFKILELLRELDVKMSFGIVNSQIISSFRMNEALESTRIEGTQTTMQEVFESQVSKKDNEDIREVMNYLDALEIGKARVTKDKFIASRTIKEIHQELLKGDVRGSNRNAGNFRRTDDIWLGKEGSTKETASYIPPSNIMIADYMANLEKFINEDESFPTAIQVAITHAQFESIHPFLDGNGRVGRILIPLMFELKEDTTLSNLFISKQLEVNKFKYYGLLNGTRKEEPEWFKWVDFFLESIEDSITEAIRKYDAILNLYNKYENKDDLSYTKVLDHIFSYPIVSVPQLIEKVGLSRPTITRVLNRMVEEGLVYKSDDLRNTQYICYDLLRVM